MQSVTHSAAPHSFHRTRQLTNGRPTAEEVGMDGAAVEAESHAPSVVTVFLVALIQ